MNPDKEVLLHLKACARRSDFQLGMNVHTLVVKTEFDFDVYVKTCLLCLYVKCGYLEHAHNIFDEMPEKNVVFWTTVICGYIEARRYREAIDTFCGLLEMGLRSNSFSLVRVLFACGRLGDIGSGVGNGLMDT
ncbi:hypothetical protein ACFX13_047133 [Malus domestica]